MQRALAIGVLLAASMPAVAQFPLQGFLYNWDRPTLAAGISTSIRWGATAEQTLARFDRVDYPEWGLNAAGATQIQGFAAWIADNNDATVEAFNLVAYEESATQANFPNLATPKLNVGPIPMPPTGVPAGGRLWRMSATLTLPVTFAANRDVFVGIGLPALISTAPLDGLFIGEARVDPALAPRPFDVPGPKGQLGQVPQDSYICYVPTGQAARYVPPTATSLEQLALDVHVSSGVVGGVALAQTSQASYLASAQGTSNFLSGLHPDIARGDNIGFAVTANTPTVAPLNIGIVLLGFGPNVLGPTPVSAVPGVDPSSVGNICVDFLNALQFFITVQTGGVNSFANMAEGQFLLPLGPNERAIVAGTVGSLDIWWQGFVVNANGPGLQIRASGCAIQHLK